MYFIRYNFLNWEEQKNFRFMENWNCYLETKTLTLKLLQSINSFIFKFHPEKSVVFQFTLKDLLSTWYSIGLCYS